MRKAKNRTVKAMGTVWVFGPKSLRVLKDFSKSPKMLKFDVLLQLKIVTQCFLRDFEGWLRCGI